MASEQKDTAAALRLAMATLGKIKRGPLKSEALYAWAKCRAALTAIEAETAQPPADRIEIETVGDFLNAVLPSMEGH